MKVISPTENGGILCSDINPGELPTQRWAGQRLIQEIQRTPQRYSREEQPKTHCQIHQKVEMKEKCWRQPESGYCESLTNSDLSATLQAVEGK